MSIAGMVIALDMRVRVLIVVPKTACQCVATVTVMCTVAKGRTHALRTALGSGVGTACVEVRVMWRTCGVGKVGALPEQLQSWLLVLGVAMEAVQGSFDASG
jgi:hypothetical protein